MTMTTDFRMFRDEIFHECASLIDTFCVRIAARDGGL
jgi:hypothetical protein